MAKKKASNEPKKERRPRKKKPVCVQLDDSGMVADPVCIPDNEDPGDDTQRRYRYQHAYGVILLTAIYTKLKPYLALWCEHHDDFLGQLNGTYDSFQVKTREPELGHWELLTDGFVSAIKKFAVLETRFPGRINAYYFVTNTKLADSSAEGKVARSPVKLRVAVRAATAPSDLVEPFCTMLKQLASDAGTTDVCLFAVIKRLDYIIGPSLADFEDVLCHTHISKIESCRSFPTHELSAIRDELIQRVYDASSNYVPDPAKHWSCLDGSDGNNPRLRSKRLVSAAIDEAIRAKSHPYFRFSPIATKTDKRVTENNLSTLEKKLFKGNLRQQMETMLRRTISTEQHLIELAITRPESVRGIRNQLEAVVQGVCDDAFLLAQSNGHVSGPEMLRRVLIRLEEISKERPSNVHNQSYDCLVGMAGLLTEACSVWWSEQFDLQEDLV